MRRRKVPPVVTGAAEPDTDASATPDTRGIPPLQELPRIVCRGCGGKVIRTHHWKEWRYYVCRADPQCVDRETHKPMITKVRAV